MIGIKDDDDLVQGNNPSCKDIDDLVQANDMSSDVKVNADDGIKNDTNDDDHVWFDKDDVIKAINEVGTPVFFVYADAPQWTPPERSLWPLPENTPMPPQTLLTPLPAKYTVLPISTRALVTSGQKQGAAVSRGFKREAIPIKNHDVQSLIRWIQVPHPGGLNRIKSSTTASSA